MGDKEFVKGTRLTEVKPTDIAFRKICDKMHETIHPTSNVNNFEIVKIFHIENDKNWLKYTENRDKKLYYELNHEYTEEKLLYHASPNARKIGHDGFDLQFAKSTGLFGAGIYFAENSSKSNCYAFGLGQGCKSHNKKDCSLCERIMLLCRVSMGKIHKTQNFFTNNKLPEGCHSLHFTAENRESEIIIFDEDQVYPSLIIKYKAHYKSE